MPPIGLPLLIAILPLAGLAVLQFIMPILGTAMTAELARRPEDYGRLGGAMGLGTLAYLASNHALLPALGPLRTIRLGLLVAIGGLGLVTTGVWPAMLAGAALIGFGYGTTAPAGSQVLADFTPRNLWGTLFSLRQAAVPVGGLLAGGLGTWLVAAHGWRAALHAVILLLGLIGLGLLIVPRRYNNSRPLLPFRGRALLAPSNLQRPFRQVRAIPGLASLVVAGWGLAAVHATVTSFYVIFLHTALAVPLARAALLFAVIQAGAIVGRILFGALADRLGTPVGVLKLLAPMAGLAAVLLAVHAPGWTAAAQLAAAIVIGLTLSTWNGLFLAEVARLAPPDRVGDATGSAGFFTFSAYMLAPPIVGWLAIRFGYPVALTIAAAGAGLATLILFTRASPPPPPHARLSPHIEAPTPWQRSASAT